MAKKTELFRAAAFAFSITSASSVAATPASPVSALSSMKIDLPSSDRTFPAGPGVGTVTSSCLTCHSAGMILNQPALSKAVWDAEVRKMISVYKAPVAPEDIETIVSYLATIKGAK